MERRVSARATVAWSAVVTLLAAGCGGLFYPFGPGGDFAEPSPLATYESGTATLKLEDGTVVELDGISTGPHLFTEVGGSVNWFNDDGWGLRVTLYPEGLPGDAPHGAFITLDRIQGAAHWTTMEDGACSVDIEVADETALRGSARCIELEWVDTLRGGTPFMGPPEPVEGEEPFDVEITFEAEP